MTDPIVASILALVFGLLIGSFLNVVIFRLPRDLSVVSPSRSFCPECEYQIAWYDNIPVVSWLRLGRKCRNCRTPIPWRYPAVELLTGILFLIAVWKLGPTWAAIKLCLYFAILVALLFTDLDTRILPDELTIGGALAGIGFASLVLLEPIFASFFLPVQTAPWITSMVEAAIGAVFPALVLWSFGTLYEKIRKREGLGFGDVKMIAMVGAFTGTLGAFFTLMLGSAVGSIAGLAYIYIAKKDASTYELPLGTFLAVVALLLELLRIF
jgi:leader peptidase (prepilin peptidase) / N-methyltransferase